MPHDELRLYPFQSDGVKHLLLRRSVLLADEMGLGKTIQAISAMQQLFTAGAIRRALVVCPASLCRNWRKEIAIWGGNNPAVIYEGASRYGMLEGNARILIASYETISADLKRETRLGSHFYDIGVDLLVLDEAQRIKAPSSVRARVLSHVLAPRRWAISGTPLENHPRELASILRFLFPNEFAEDTSLDDMTGVFAARDRCMVRRTKSQVGLELPPRTVSYMPVVMTPDQQADYEQVRQQVCHQVVNADSRGAAATAILTGLQQLRQTAAISTSGSSAKVDAIEEELEDIVAVGGKVVVFSFYANVALPAVHDRLARFGAVMLTGAMSSADKEKAHTRFLEDESVHVMCAGLQAAGVGLTWNVAQYVYHLDLWWNPQVLRQAEDRVHRIGQSNPVLIKRLIAEGTIDENIAHLLTAKEAVFDYVIGDQANPPVDQPGFEELVKLIGLKLSDLKIS
mgnify:CR=1 FL=1